jgi:hypothetical protein
MTSSRGDAADVVHLADIRRQLRRALRPIFVCALLGLDLGILFLFSQPRDYRATADVLVTDISLYRATVQAPRPRNLTLDTEAQRLKAVAVVEFGTAGLDDVAVTAPPGTKVLRVSVNATSGGPEQVSVRATDLVAAYLRARLDGTRAERAAELDRLAASKQVLRRQIAELRGADGPPAAQLVTIRGLRDRLDQLRRRQRVLLTGTSDVGRLLRGPLTTGPTWHNPTVAPTSGLLLGAFTGFAWSSLRRRRVRSADDLKRLTRSLVLRAAPGDALDAPMTRQALARLGATTRGDLPLLPVDDAPLPADLVAELAQSIAQSRTSPLLPTQNRTTQGGLATIPLQRARPVLGDAVTTPAGATLAATSPSVVLLVPWGTAEENVRSANDLLELMGTRVAATVLLDREPQP